MKDYKIIIGERLNSVLAQHNVTQKELADAIGVKPNVISYFCSGIRTPNSEQIIKIAKYLNVSADYLLCRTDVKTTDTTIRDICEYTGLTEKAVLKIRSCKGIFPQTSGSKTGQTYMDFVYPINFLIESDNFFHLVHLLSDLCYLCFTNDFPVELENPIDEETNNIIKNNIHSYCLENKLKIIKKYEMGSFKLYEAQHELLNIFKKLLDASFDNK